MRTIYFEKNIPKVLLAKALRPLWRGCVSTCHIALRVTSEGEQLLWGVDTALHPIHVEHPDWVSKADYLPHETVVTRRRLLGQAAVDRALVHMYHFPFPGLGHVVLHDGGWRWQPLVLPSANV